MNKVIHYILKTIFNGLLISFVIAVVLITIECVFGRTMVFDEKLVVELGYYALYGVTLTAINSTFFEYLNHYVIWEKYTKYRLLIGAFGSVLLTMLGIFGLRILTRVVIEGRSFAEFLIEEKFRYYIISLLLTFVTTFFGIFIDMLTNMLPSRRTDW